MLASCLLQLVNLLLVSEFSFHVSQIHLDLLLGGFWKPFFFTLSNSNGLFPIIFVSTLPSDHQMKDMHQLRQLQLFTYIQRTSNIYLQSEVLFILGMPIKYSDLGHWIIKIWRIPNSKFLVCLGHMIIGKTHILCLIHGRLHK